MSQFKKGGAPIIEDFMRMAEGALGSVAGMRGELETMIRQQGERLLSRMDVPTREEFEVLKDMTAKALARLDAIEKRLDGAAGKPAPAKKKPAGK